MYFEFTAIAQQHTGSLKQHLRANARLKSCLFFRMHIYTELGYVHGKTETGMQIMYPSMKQKRKEKIDNTMQRFNQGIVRIVERQKKCERK